MLRTGWLNRVQNRLPSKGTPRPKRGDGRAVIAAEISLLESRTLLVAPDIAGTVANQPVNDNATLSPFASVTVTDPDTENMFARVTILNGTVRGDFTPASATDWTRSVVGNNIIYEQFYAAQANIGSVVQADIRALVFDPRTDAIGPGATELTDFSLYVTDGTNSDTDTATRVVTTSVNNAPGIGGILVNQAVNDNATIAPFSTLTVTDPDTQDLFAKVTITNGVMRGDFAAATTAGWTRTVVGSNIVYSRYYSPADNIGVTVQTDIRAFVFDPQSDDIEPGATETTAFTVSITDGIATATNSQTTVITSSVNDAPLIGGALANQAVNDNATILPFSTLTVTDPDTQDLFAKVTIANGVVRGDLTAATTAGWTRTVVGNNIVYSRYYSPGDNIGAAVQADIRAFVFDPRSDVLEPGVTETTAFTVYVTDGITTATNTQTTVVTTSVNDAPTINGAVSNQAVNDNATIAPFSTLTVSDPDTQDLLAKVTIVNGVNRGDFTVASTVGWTRTVLGSDIVYQRYYSPAENIGATVQADIRALVFDPRSDVIEPGATETTVFRVFLNDGLTTVTNTQTSVVTTSVNNAPVISGTVANQTINDDETVAAFGTLTIADSDAQDLFVQVTIDSGVVRGDFTAASATGWTRTVVGANIVYTRYFAPGDNIGATAQASIRALIFEPNNVLQGETETTAFAVFVNDGLATTTNSTTSVVTTGVAGNRSAASASAFRDSDITVVVV